MRALIDYRAALRERSGVGEYTHQLAVSLLKACENRSTTETCEVALFSSSWKDRLRASDELAGARLVDRRVPVRVLNFAWHRLERPSIEQITGLTIDVAHSLHPLLTPTRRAAQVVTIHDLNFLFHPERTRAEIRRDYPKLAASHAARADRVIVVSAFTAQEVTRHLEVAPERISVCSPGAPDWAPRTGAAPKDGYVLFFGTLEPRKNVGGLLDAYALLIAKHGSQVPPLRLAGKPTEQSAPVLERIQRPPLSRYVTHVGYVDPSKRRELYEGARLLVQPSFEEGFGLPVLEAMTVGVPVVAANRGALPEVLGGAGILVEPDHPEAIADAIWRYVDDPSAAATAIAAGHARARQYSWAHTADATLSAYRSAIAYRAERGHG